MSLNAHIAHLEAQHLALEHDIKEESLRPLPDFVHITDLKKRKLRIKEEIARLYSEHDQLEEAGAMA